MDLVHKEDSHYMHRLSRAKTQLVLDYPFLGTIALGLPFYLDREIPTAVTNGRAIWFNPTFMEELGDDELLFVVAHECLHPALGHNTRCGGRDPRIWTCAIDYIVNQILTEEGIGKAPTRILLSKEIYDAGGGTSDGVYTVLKGIAASDSGYNGEPLDECVDGGGTPAEKRAAEEFWRIKVAQAMRAAKMAGKLSGSLQRRIQEVIEPKVDWRHALQDYMVKLRTDSRTWARPNRRLLPQGVYAASRSGDTVGEVYFAIDCSGSITEQTLSQYAREVRTVQEDLRPTALHVLYFDTKVLHVDTYTPEDSVVISPHGGGGTAYSPIFREVQRRGEPPVVMVVLTDLYCSDFGPPPEYPVLWATTGDISTPFGDTIQVQP
jgi:predicted metal-dependent peptidase